MGITNTFSLWLVFSSFNPYILMSRCFINWWSPIYNFFYFYVKWVLCFFRKKFAYPKDIKIFSYVSPRRFTVLASLFRLMIYSKLSFVIHIESTFFFLSHIKRSSYSAELRKTLFTPGFVWHICQKPMKHTCVCPFLHSLFYSSNLSVLLLANNTLSWFV